MNTSTLRLKLFKNLLIGTFYFLLGHTTVEAMAPKLDWNKAIDRAVLRYGMRTEPELKKYFQQVIKH